MARHEFLPLCDVLFNIISLAAYFCDIVFDVVMGYALYSYGHYVPFALTMLFVGASATVEQTMSLRWYLAGHAVSADKSTAADRLERSAVQALHFVQLGVLWRYFKLFVPVDLRYVKYEVRDLCMLRLLHAFCESMPLLLLQSYLFWTDEGVLKHLRDLNKVAISLSTVSVCWALASFGKNVRMQNVHRLVLTWLGVIFQFLWRLGTVGARVVSLTAYASMYKYWVLLVLVLHWLCMLLWLHSPKNVFHGERMSALRKTFLFALLAFVFTFEYVNLLENNHREKMFTFYIVMALENALLMSVWGYDSGDAVKPLIVLGLFCFGLTFMAIYYQFFHVRRLDYEAGGRLSNATNSNNSTAKLALEAKYKDETTNVPNFKADLIRRHSFSSVYENIPPGGYLNQIVIGGEPPPALQRNQRYYSALPASVHNGIPGVFNCRFTNPYMAAMQKRKKKKPTTFVPPPSSTGGGGRDSVAFWCKPPESAVHSQHGSSENESAGSRVDVRQKLEEKRQRELVEIEEDIRQGKLKIPTFNEEVLLCPQGYLRQQNAIAPPFTAQNANVHQPMDPAHTLMFKLPSDLESQISLPRSYTLPKEYKFYRKMRPRKAMRSDHFITSTNSSDGDVDSADDDSDTSLPKLSPRPLRLPNRNVINTRHETKL